ncbi:helix-turn-helix domain-containing protein [Thiomicrorhabdus arctica]|jgi:AraC family ethanolamine operon transcriptional activator|uniref:helix-turn-helix domain-containing protein n=1 Tax=Thiomicrorhabdus arctica TaxID=131540 RepID=UPI000477D86B|nr:helix-turn-helix domain-containing protein [Thiomicrorhabdus arctica]
MSSDEISSALNRCVLRTDDLDQQADSLTNWLQEYDQMSEGCFYGSVDKLTSHNFHVFKEETSRALRQQCQIWTDAIWFGIPLEEDLSFRINGQNLMPNNLATRSGDQAFELVTPENFQIYGVVLEGELLNRMATLQGVELREWDVFKNPTLELAPQKLMMLKSCLGTIMDDSSHKMDSYVREDLLMTCLLHALPNESSSPKLLPSYQHRKVVVERVKEYMKSHQQLPVTITELCQIAYVSRRTLQYSFETILGYSPLQFLRLTRLNQVRRALKTADKDSTVTETAEKWGFTHAGQFSHDYKKTFGESPSQTLRKAL